MAPRYQFHQWLHEQWLKRHQAEAEKAEAKAIAPAVKERVVERRERTTFGRRVTDRRND
jgi:hypothetical protein